MTTEEKQPEQNSTNSASRRHLKRLPLKIPVKLNIGQELFNGKTCDMSASGLGIIAPDNFPECETFTVHCKLKTGRIFHLKVTQCFRTPATQNGSGFIRLGLKINNPDEMFHRIYYHLVGKQRKAVIEDPDTETATMATLHGIRYKFQRIQGKGGFADVYLVQDTILKRLVAMKVLFKNMAEDNQMRRDFLREAQIAAQFHHPNIVLVYEVGEISPKDYGTALDFPAEILSHHPERFIYISMQYVEGPTLRYYLNPKKRLPLTRSLDFLCETLDALSFAHAKGVVHRDIKPENILISPEGKAMVTDFGIAVVNRESELYHETRPHATSFTPTYASPEQITNRQLDFRSDIYSFGVVAYELITGRPPFLGHEVKDVVLAHLKEKPEPFATHGVDADPQLEKTILKCLEKNPDDRFQSAQEIMTILTRLKTPVPGFSLHSMDEVVETLIDSIIIARTPEKSKKAIRQLLSFLQYEKNKQDNEKFTKIQAAITNPSVLECIIEKGLQAEDQEILWHFFSLVRSSAAIFLLLRWFDKIRKPKQKQMCARLAVACGQKDLVSIATFGLEQSDANAVILLRAFRDANNDPEGHCFKTWARHQGRDTQLELLKNVKFFNPPEEILDQILENMANGKTTVHHQVKDLARRMQGTRSSFS